MTYEIILIATLPENLRDPQSLWIIDCKMLGYMISKVISTNKGFVLLLVIGSVIEGKL